MTLYITEKAKTHAHPELVAYHAAPLLDFFGTASCWDVTASACHRYVEARTSGMEGRKPVKVGTARRELETLGAALGHAYDARKLSKPVRVHLPEKAPRRERWLTRPEAARLIAGALGFSPEKIDRDGRASGFKRIGKPSYHVARFILICLYTCTRHEAALNLRWGVNSQSGWIDLTAGIIYRRGEGERETRKRRTPAPIPDNLAPHLRRWRRMTALGPCEYEGRLTLRQKTGFERARELAKLGPEVTPHTLKHTGITWLLQNGVPVWEVAGFTGTSPKMIQEVYGHHAPDHMPAARRGFRGRFMGGSR
jgi:integrase